MKEDNICCVLDYDGVQCKNKATKATRIFLDDTMHGFAVGHDIGWVKIPVCRKHYKILKFKKNYDKPIEKRTEREHTISDSGYENNKSINKHMLTIVASKKWPNNFLNMSKQLLDLGLVTEKTYKEELKKYKQH